MNVVNTNKKEKKYLTYEEVKEKYEKIGKKYKFYGFALPEVYNDKRKYLNRIDSYSMEWALSYLQSLPEENRQLLKEYANLFDRVNPNRYKLLNRLIYICKDKIYKIKDYYDQYEDPKYMGLVSNDELIKRLRKTFRIFKSLKNPNRVLDKMFDDDETAPCYAFNESDVFRTLLNDSEFYDYLVINKHLFDTPEIEGRDMPGRKYDKITKQMVEDFFPKEYS